MNNDIFGLIDIIVFGGGLYCFYAFFMMKTKGEINQTLLLSKDVDVRKCRDTAAYLSYVLPKVLILGVFTTIAGIVGLVNSYVTEVDNKIYFGSMGIFLAVLIYYAVTTRKAYQNFF